MIVYFDTSAFVPLLVAEPSSESCGRLWNEADDVVTTRLLYVESAAALAQALRMGRLTTREHRSTLRIIDRAVARVRSCRTRSKQSSIELQNWPTTMACAQTMRCTVLPLSSSTMAISSWPAEIKNCCRRAHL